jgi:FkbM family methyltransferase
MTKDEWLKAFRYQEHGHKYWPADFEFLWPTRDESLHGDIPTLAQLDTDVFPLIKEKGVAVQAGGAMGMWAKRMAQVFDVVYTFEPTPDSFYCLNFNCPEENIVAFNAALGDSHKMINMQFPEHKARSKAGKENLGGFRCFDGGITPTLRLDDLALPRCDLLMLDLEGYELFALMGAARIIETCRPVIVMEDKGCSRVFGYEKGDVEKHLAEKHQYRTLKRFHGGRDVVCVPVDYECPE